MNSVLQVLRLGRGADAQLDERVRQVAPLHRETARHRGVLPVPGGSTDRAPPPDPRSSSPLPLAHSSHRPSPQVVPIAGRSKSWPEPSEVSAGTKQPVAAE